MDHHTDLAQLMAEHPSHDNVSHDASRLEREILWSKRHAWQILSALGLVLYAVRLPDGLIKIGCTAHLYERLKNIAPNGELLAFRFGDMSEEFALHKALAAHVAHGREYYRPTPEVLAVVNSWRSALNMPAVLVA